MFNQLGWGEILVLVVVGLFVFGPERLPKMAAELARGLKKVRAMTEDVTRDIKAELPPEVADLDLRGLTPRGLVQRHVLDGLTDRPAAPAPTAARRARGSLSVSAEAVPVGTGAAVSRPVAPAASPAASPVAEAAPRSPAPATRYGVDVT